MLRESFLIVGEACPGGAVVIVTSCARQLLMVTFAQFAIACSLSRQLYENFLSIYIIVSGILFHLIPSEVTAGRRRCVCVCAGSFRCKISGSLYRREAILLFSPL